MEKLFLPYRFKFIGYGLFLAGIISGYLVLEHHYMPDFLDVPVFAVHSQYVKKTVMGMSQTNLMDDFALLFTLTGLLLVMFSKNRNETPEVMGLRVKAIFYAVLANSFFIIISILFIFGIGFVKIAFLQLFTLPAIYLVIFRVLMLRSEKT